MSFSCQQLLSHRKGKKSRTNQERGHGRESDVVCLSWDISSLISLEVRQQGEHPADPPALHTLFVRHNDTTYLCIACGCPGATMAKLNSSDVEPTQTEIRVLWPFTVRVF